MSDIERNAQTIAAEYEAETGISAAIVIPILIDVVPRLFRCLAPDETVQSLVGTDDPALNTRQHSPVRRVARLYRQRSKGQLNREESIRLAIATLRVAQRPAANLAGCEQEAFASGPTNGE